MTRDFTYNGRKLSIQIDTAESNTAITFNNVRHIFTLTDFSDGRLVLQGEDTSYRLRVARHRDRIWIWLNGHTYDFRIPGSDDHNTAESSESGNDVRAPMPGTLVKVFVSPGEIVEERQVVAIMEAMKMEHQLRSPRAGTVEAVSNNVGSTVDTGTVIVSLTVESN